jgi:chemotaxis protein CheX
MDDKLYRPFCLSTGEIIREMSEIDIVGMDSLKEEPGEIHSMGVSSIITFAGTRKGRLLIDMEPGLALYVANTLLGEEYDNIKNQMVLSTVSEINNIVSGDAVTQLNNSYSMRLRLAPPIVFTGQDVIISIPKISSLSSWGDTDYGRIRINIAWEGGNS